ncbi:MAG TPA: methylglyoxal synthase, partial [Flavisolibacter sp.]|nr:methylglyoxal synthase [Flavisolibacter sp.]
CRLNLPIASWVTGYKTDSMKTSTANVKRIALVAHDNKKADLVEWAYYNRGILSKHKLVATGTTGNLLEEKLGTPIKKLLSGPLGGDQQLGALIAEHKLDIIIFFWDPLEAQPHDSDVKALLRIAVTWNIVIACNRTTADFVLTSTLLNEDYERVVPDFTSYMNRLITK